MRLNERSFVALIAGGLVAAAALAVVLFLALGGDDEPADSPAEAPANTASSLAGGPDEVLYLSGTALVRRDVLKATDENVGVIPSPSVYAARGSHWIAYVTSKQVDDGDFASEPVLHLYNPETDDKSGYGAGVAPVWNPSGTHVAFLRPVEPRNCQGEACPGESQIGVVEAATGDESLLLEPGTYTILGWAGEWILVSDFKDPTKIVSVSLDDESNELDMPASQYWDSSPDGRWVVKANAKKTEFVEISDGELGDERVPVELGDFRLLEGTWAHDSSGVAAVVSLESTDPKKGKKGGKGKGRGARSEEGTRIVTFSPDDPEPATVPGTFGATGNVMWTVDNDGIVFASLLRPRKGLFQAMHCPLGNEGECSIVTSWSEGVALLRAE